MNSLPREQIAKTRSSAFNRLPDGQWVAITGWPLAELGAYAHECACPSLLVFAQQARPLWRQSVYFALAVGDLRRLGTTWEGQPPLTSDSGPDQEHMLALLSPTEIIARSLASKSAGIVSALRKLGHEPLDREGYSLLAEWFQEPGRHAKKLRVLENMAVLDQERIDALASLCPEFLTPSALPFITSYKAAQEMNRLLTVIRRLCGSATEEAIAESAKCLQGQLTLAGWARDWLRKADKLLAPFPADAFCRPLVTGDELIDAGARFKNCLGDQCMTAILCGRICAVEYLKEPAIAILAKLSGSAWVVGGIHGPRNRPVRDDLASEFRARLATYPGVYVAADYDREDAVLIGKYFGMYEPFELELIGFD